MNEFILAKIIISILVPGLIFWFVLRIENHREPFNYFAYESFHGVLSSFKIHERFEEMCKNIDTNVTSTVVLDSTSDEQFAHAFFDRYQELVGSTSNGRKLISVDLKINDDKSFSIIGTLTMSEDDLVSNWINSNVNSSFSICTQLTPEQLNSLHTIKTEVPIDLMTKCYPNRCRIVHRLINSENN